MKIVNDANNLIMIMLNLADIADEKHITPFENEMGYGFRAFTSYIRSGIKEIIDLKRDYFSALEMRDYAKWELEENKAILERMFGRSDIEIYNDDEISRFRALADEIQKEMGEEVNADEDSD